MVRDRIPTRFRLYLADVGKVKAWGFPEKPRLAKNVFDYQASALAAEAAPFDVYMVDGRYRVACALLSLMHASARGGDPERIRVLFHDYDRKAYWVVEQVADLVEGSFNVSERNMSQAFKTGKLAVLKRRPGVSDETILLLWNQFKWAAI
jgi:hypothetical protein